MNESRHIWMRHVTYEWVTSHMNETCHIWMSHVTWEWVTSECVTSRENEAYQMCILRWVNHTGGSEWVMSRMNESCHIWTSYVWISHVTHVTGDRPIKEEHSVRLWHVTYEWVMSHINHARHTWTSLVTYESTGDRPIKEEHSDRKKPPPPGGFPVYYVPWSRTRRKRNPLEAPGINSSRGVLFLRILDQGT